MKQVLNFCWHFLLHGLTALKGWIGLAKKHRHDLSGADINALHTAEPLPYDPVVRLKL